MITNLPTDPFMLMSYINQQLRDNYPSLEELCKSLDIDENTLNANLKSVGFEYNPDANNFGKNLYRRNFGAVINQPKLTPKLHLLRA